MNDKTVLIIEKLFLVVMGCLFVFIGLMAKYIDANVKTDEQSLGLVISYMAPGVLVLLGLFSKWLAVVAHVVITIVTAWVIIIGMSMFGYGALISAFVPLLIAVLLLRFKRMPVVAHVVIFIIVMTFVIIVGWLVEGMMSSVIFIGLPIAILLFMSRILRAMEKL